MDKVRLGVMNEQCDQCGHPFDRGDLVYDLSENGDGPFLCSQTCMYSYQLVKSEAIADVTDEPTTPPQAHSPGPWITKGLTIWDWDAGIIANCSTAKPEAENHANARLIAASTELLAVAELALRILDRDGIRPYLGLSHTQTEVERIQAAIAKATE